MFVFIICLRILHYILHTLRTSKYWRQHDHPLGPRPIDYVVATFNNAISISCTTHYIVVRANRLGRTQH